MPLSETAKQLGQALADRILNVIEAIPAEHRANALKAGLENVEAVAPADVERLTMIAVDNGMSYKAALRTAIAAYFANRFAAGEGVTALGNVTTTLSANASGSGSGTAGTWSSIISGIGGAFNAVMNGVTSYRQQQSEATQQQWANQMAERDQAFQQQMQLQQLQMQSSQQAAMMPQGGQMDPSYYARTTPGTDMQTILMYGAIGLVVIGGLFIVMSKK